jgi:hypothetical protein
MLISGTAGARRAPPFLRSLGLREVPAPSPVQTPIDPVQARALRTKVQALLDKGAVPVVKDHSSPGYYSHIFLVPKKSGEWYLIIDLSRLNRFLRVPRFKMATTRLAAMAIQPAPEISGKPPSVGGAPMWAWGIFPRRARGQRSLFSPSTFWRCRPSFLCASLPVHPTGGSALPCSPTTRRSSRIFGDGAGHIRTLCAMWDLFQLCPSGDRTDSASHPREKEHPSGCPLPGQPSRPDRMDPSLGRCSEPCGDVGCSHSRSVGHQVEQATSPILLPLPDNEALGVDSPLLMRIPHSSHPCSLEAGRESLWYARMGIDAKV